MIQMHELNIEQAHALLRAREISATELCRTTLERFLAVEDRLRAFLTVDQDGALAQAAVIDEKIAAGDIRWSPLTGIPIALKDNLCTRGLKTTCGSRILERYVPPYDATVIRHLRDSGAVLIGKTNMDEFAMGSSTENSAFFATRNAWTLECVPGGSSGGSATAVAAGQAYAALGSDTGGSIRQPAALSGIVGMKPTYGRVSRYGLVAFASSLDQIGPLAGNVRDAAMLLQAIGGHDPMDSTSVQIAVPDYLEHIEDPIRGMRVGVPRECFGPGLDPEVAAAVRKAIDDIAAMGCDVVEVSMPHSDYAIACYYIIAPAEASSNLARYDGVRYGSRAEHYANLAEMYQVTRSEGFGAEVKRRIMIGTYVLSAGYYDAYYLKAQKVRTLICRDFDEKFKDVDVIISAVSPTVALKKGASAESAMFGELQDVLVEPSSIAGLPGLSVPCGFSKGLPIGMQIMGPQWSEEKLLQVGYAYQQETDWHLKRPKM